MIVKFEKNDNKFVSYVRWTMRALYDLAPGDSFE